MRVPRRTLPVEQELVQRAQVLPRFGDAMSRLARLELDLELTARLLELRAAGGDWPDDDRPSRVCPEERWVVSAAADGRRTLALSRDVDWPDLRGARLPTSLSVGP